MMKYLKAEAEIIKFDNSDVVTLSKGDVEENCGTDAVSYVDRYCKFIWLTAFIKWLIEVGRCLAGYTDAAQGVSEASLDSQNSSGGGDWL